MEDLNEYLNSRKNEFETKQAQKESAAEKEKREKEEYKTKFSEIMSVTIRPEMAKFETSFQKVGHKLSLEKESLQNFPFQMEYTLTLNEGNNGKWLSIVFKANQNIGGFNFYVSSPMDASNNKIEKEYKFDGFDIKNIEQDIIQCLKKSTF
jgi:hypothetical protein